MLDEVLLIKSALNNCAEIQVLQTSLNPQLNTITIVCSDTFNQRSVQFPPTCHTNGGVQRSLSPLNFFQTVITPAYILV